MEYDSHDYFIDHSSYVVEKENNKAQVWLKLVKISKDQS